MGAFLEGNQLAVFAVLGDKTQRYNFIRKTLVKFSYMSLSKKDKGVVIRYLIKMTDYSRQQLARLIQKYTNTGTEKRVRSFCAAIRLMDLKVLWGN